MLACRPMLCFALAAMGGAVAARHWPALADWSPYGWGVFLVLGVWFVLTPRPRQPNEDIPGLPDGYGELILPRPGFLARRGLNRFILIGCLACFLVAVWRQDARHTAFARNPFPGRWFSATLLALGPNREHPGETGQWRIPAVLLTVDGHDAGRYPVLLSGPDGAAFRRGDLIQCRARHDDFRVKPYPGAFDYRFWLERDGLAAPLSVEKPRNSATGVAAYQVVPMDDAPLYTRARRLLDAIRAKAIELTLRHGGPHGGVLSLMLYGFRKDVGTELRDSFRRVGIGHVLAISGLHVGLIVGLLWWASGWFGWPSRWRAVVCLALAVGYFGLSGGQVAAGRATLMAVIHLGGIAFGRKSDMMNSLGAAAFFLVLANPSAPLDVSFQLSFIAVVFIFLALDRRPGRREPFNPEVTPLRRRLLTELSSLVRLSVSTWFGLFPVIAVVFNQVNLAGLPVNIVVIPLMSLVLAGGLLLPWLGWIPGMSWALTLPTWLLTAIARLADAVPYSSFPANAPPKTWMLLFYLFVFLLLVRGMVKNRRPQRVWNRAAVAGVAVSIAGMALGMGASPPPERGRLAMLPGRGFGVIVAESPQGGIALVGTFARGGLNEAGWLRSLRRGGEVAVVAIGGDEDEELPALDYHYPIRTLGRIPAVDRDAVAASEWRPVEGAPGVEYAVSRDSRGRAVWLAARVDGRTLCVAPRLAARQFTWRLERHTPGADADLLVIGFSGRRPDPQASIMPRGRVAVIGRYDGELPAGWFERRRYGVLLLDSGLKGFDGTGYQCIMHN